MTKLSSLEDRADVLISIVLLASWAAIALSSNWGNWPPDLSALFMAGHFWSLGQYDLIYAAPETFFGPGVESWRNEIAELGHQGERFFPFVYPPIWAAIAAPLAKSLGPAGFFNSVYVVHIAMIAVSIWLSYRLIRPSVPLTVWCVVCCGLLLMSLIANLALYHNQLQITVTFLIILSLERYRAGASITAGVALGLAAAIKITPAALGIIFLIDRDFRAAAATAVTGLTMLALSLLIAGVDLHAEFLSQISDITGQIAIMHVNWNFEAFLIQLKVLIAGPPLHGLELTPNFGVAEPLWVSITTKLACLAGIALVLYRTKDLNREDSLRIRPFGLILVLTMCAPLGWSHHYLPILLLAPAVLTFQPPIRAISILAVFGGLTSLGMFSLLENLNTQVHVRALVSVTTLLGLFALYFVQPVAFTTTAQPVSKPRPRPYL